MRSLSKGIYNRSLPGGGAIAAEFPRWAYPGALKKYRKSFPFVVVVVFLIYITSLVAKERREGVGQFAEGNQEGSACVTRARPHLPFEHCLFSFPTFSVSKFSSC